MGAKSTSEVKYLTTAEAAKELGITPGLVRRDARAGLLPGKQFGRDWVFLREDVMRHGKRPRRGPGYPKGRKRPERAAKVTDTQSTRAPAAAGSEEEGEG